MKKLSFPLCPLATEVYIFLMGIHLCYFLVNMPKNIFMNMCADTNIYTHIHAYTHIHTFTSLCL